MITPALFVKCVGKNWEKSKIIKLILGLDSMKSPLFSMINDDSYANRESHDRHGT